MGKHKLWLLKGMYGFIALGLTLTIWPDILLRDDYNADSDSVILALLGALSLLCVLGIFRPMKMLPLLMFEFLWKFIWVLGFALPMALMDKLDPYASDTLFACVIGLVLVPLVLPWRYIKNQYFQRGGNSISTQANMDR